MCPRFIVVAMSGGVDSSVAAFLLKKKGYEVAGLTMNLFDLPAEDCRRDDLRRCCGRKAIEDANRVAGALGIPHYVVDVRKEFSRYVIRDFCREYASGRTPNPCIRCNEHIKFRLLAEKGRKLGAGALATGHYARVSRDRRSGCFVLKKAKDKSKDQSYFLYSLTQDQLAFSIFPLGDVTKEEVRRIARRLGLPVAKKPESQEICFVPDRDLGRFLEKHCPEALVPGPIVDAAGRVLGRHQGVARYTVGQRRRMGIVSPLPLYVLSIDPAANTVTAGTEKELYGRELEARDVHFIFLEGLARPMQAKARVRYRHREAEASIRPLGTGRVRVKFKKPQRAITPGQSVVFYKKDVVVGGGIID